MKTVILGKQGSGKTTKAKELVNGRTACWISAKTDKVEVLVFDEVVDLEDAKAFLTDQDNSTDDIILCSQNLTPEDFAGMEDVTIIVL
jgi:adenylate kinase family enzyme